MHGGESDKIGMNKKRPFPLPSHAFMAPTIGRCTLYFTVVMRLIQRDFLE